MPAPDTFAIWGEFITLGQLVKALNLVGSGAEVKMLLADGGIQVNGEEENRRGRKIRPGDTVIWADGTKVEIIPGTPEP